MCATIPAGKHEFKAPKQAARRFLVFLAGVVRVCKGDRMQEAPRTGTPNAGLHFVSFDPVVCDTPKFQQMNLTWILVAILIIALVALVVAFPKSSTSSAPSQPSLVEGFVQATGAPSLVPPSKQPVSVGPTNVLELQSGDEADGFLSQGPAILMVYATWCGHCKNMMPAYDQASTMTSVKFARLEGHKAQQFLQKHGIRGFPTLLTVNRGNELGRHMGGRDIGSLLAAANALVTPPAPTVSSEAPADAVVTVPPPGGDASAPAAPTIN